MKESELTDLIDLRNDVGHLRNVKEILEHCVTYNVRHSIEFQNGFNRGFHLDESFVYLFFGENYNELLLEAVTKRLDKYEKMLNVLLNQYNK